MSVADRINILCNKEGSQSNFAEKTGIQRQTVSRIVNRGTGIRSDTIEAIAIAYPNLNLRWLIIGEDPMWLNDTHNPEEVPTGRPLNPSGDPEEHTDKKIIGLLENRVRELEREIRRNDPGLAEELGID